MFSIMPWWGWIVSYLGIGFSVTLWCAYQNGQHYGEVHKQAHAKEGCDDPCCIDPFLMPITIGALWFITMPMLLCFYIYWKFQEGGANSKLPPLNSHEDLGKKKDIDFLA